MTRAEARIAPGPGVGAKSPPRRADARPWRDGAGRGRSGTLRAPVAELHPVLAVSGAARTVYALGGAASVIFKEGKNTTILPRAASRRHTGTAKASYTSRTTADSIS